MARFTNYGENQVIDWLMRAQSPTLPAAWHVALFTATPSETGGGTEVSGGGYARVAVTRSLTNWSGTQAAGSTTASTGTLGRSSNNAIIDFGTASADWGTVTGMALMDAGSGGNMWIYSALTTARTVLTGDPVQFPADALGVSAL